MPAGALPAAVRGRETGAGQPVAPCAQQGMWGGGWLTRHRQPKCRSEHAMLGAVSESTCRSLTDWPDLAFALGELSAEGLVTLSDGQAHCLPCVPRKLRAPADCARPSRHEGKARGADAQDWPSEAQGNVHCPLFSRKWPAETAPALMDVLRLMRVVI